MKNELTLIEIMLAGLIGLLLADRGMGDWILGLGILYIIGFAIFVFGGCKRW